MAQIIYHPEGKAPRKQVTHQAMVDAGLFPDRFFLWLGRTVRLGYFIAIEILRNADKLLRASLIVNGLLLLALLADLIVHVARH